MGGLGIRNLAIKNHLFLSKLCWKLSSFPLNLAAWTTSTKYLYRAASPFSFNKGSFIWRGLKEPWNTFTGSCKWAVGNVEDIGFWEDRWVGNTPLREVIHGPLSRSDCTLKVADCICQNKWKWDQVTFYLPSIVTDE